MTSSPLHLASFKVTRIYFATQTAIVWAICHAHSLKITLILTPRGFETILKYRSRRTLGDFAHILTRPHDLPHLKIHAPHDLTAFSPCFFLYFAFVFATSLTLAPPLNAAPHTSFGSLSRPLIADFTTILRTPAHKICHASPTLAPLKPPRTIWRPPAHETARDLAWL